MLGGGEVSSYCVEMRFDLGAHADFDRDAFEAHVDDVAEALAEIPDVDGDVGADLSRGLIDLCITVPGATREDALGRAITAARTAVHAAGGATVGWDGLLAKMLDSDDYTLSNWKSTATC